MRVSTLSELMIEPLLSNDHAQAHRGQMSGHPTRRGIVGLAELSGRAPLNERCASSETCAAAGASAMSACHPRS
jgi:hypothetical protein